MPERYHTPVSYARLVGVSPDRVLLWIRQKKLQAINSSQGHRPRYKIPHWAIEEFERDSAAAVGQKPVKRRRRKRQTDVLDIIR